MSPRGLIFVEESCDWEAVYERVNRIIVESGLTRHRVARMLGLNPESPTWVRDKAALPPLETTYTVAALLGVPVIWLLTGDGPAPQIGRPQCNMRRGVSASSSDVSESSVVQGNSGTVVINNIVASSDIQKELFRVYSLLPLRDQVELLTYAYRLEDKKELHRGFR
ncbi:helix-turn-helix transcriptional regulator [Pseudoflavonifractor sp. MCC625]|uniref:helix-turn-helix domain-containing protein n=1 Tax=Pseudoflavonifractor sp. MCC625 TaxID=2592647 RepID=UPI001C01CE53|nr:helix-turn-helix transcriptional regulator [Pseudoflavonifractor sp. MCC625]MBT9685183.1 hypothetical protein [Pseudoflavonifractor sp. MCC625]